MEYIKNSKDEISLLTKSSQKQTSFVISFIHSFVRSEVVRKAMMTNYNINMISVFHYIHFQTVDF